MIQVYTVDMSHFIDTTDVAVAGCWFWVGCTYNTFCMNPYSNRSTTQESSYKQYRYCHMGETLVKKYAKDVTWYLGSPYNIYVS